MMILSQPGRALLMFLTIAFSPALCLGQVIEVDDISFVDELHGWVAAVEQPSAAAIFRTSDGGLTWVRIPLPADIAFYRLHFLDAHIGVALHAESESRQVVYRTVDAGQTWIKVASIEPAHDGHLVDLAATSPTDVFVVGEGSLGRGYVAQLLGKSGTLCVRDDLPVDLTENSSNALGIFGDGAGHLWIVGKEMILHSADNGKTWENQFQTLITGLTWRTPALHCPAAMPG